MLQGILALVGASLIFGVIPSLNKLIMANGMSAGSVVFFSQLTICLTSFLVAGVRRISVRVTRPQVTALLFIGAVGMGATGFLLNSSYGLIPVGIATTIHFFYPALVTAAMALFFHQKMNGPKALAILFSVGGMLLIADLGGGALNWLGAAAALASSFTYALYLVANERGDINRLPLIVKLCYASMGSALLNLVLALLREGLTFPKNIPVALGLFGGGGLGLMAAFYLLTVGIRQIGASASSFFTLLEPLTSLIAGALFYREVPGTSAVFGCALVFLSVAFVAWDGFRTARRAKEQAG